MIFKKKLRKVVFDGMEYYFQDDLFSDKFFFIQPILRETRIYTKTDSKCPLFEYKAYGKFFPSIFTGDPKEYKSDSVDRQALQHLMWCEAMGYKLRK